MVTREELEQLKCGDVILVNGNKRIFIGLKPSGMSFPAIYLDKDTLAKASEFEAIGLIKPKKKLYAYRIEGTTEITFRLLEGVCMINKRTAFRAPEWDMGTE